MFPNDMPWYKSRIIIGAVVSVLTKILVLTGLTDQVIDDAALTDTLLLVGGGFADLYVMWQRVTQKASPAITT